MLNLKHGSIFDIKCDLMVVPCNNFGNVSSQIASGLTTNGVPRFGRKMELGEVYFVEGQFVNTSIIAYAASVDVDKEETSLDSIQRIMDRIRDYSVLHEIESINMPVFGTDAGRVDPGAVYNIIKSNFWSTNIYVSVFVLTKNMFNILSSFDSVKYKHFDEEKITSLKKAASFAVDNKNDNIVKTQIHDAEKKYQIFVSSTYGDLKEERKEATQALLECGCIPAGMELFPAASNKQWEIIKSVIDDCDAYLLILAGRYGSMGIDDKGEKVGYTEMEFDYALKTNKPIVAFLHSDFGTIESNKVEATEEGKKRLNEFYEKVKDGRLIKYWTNKDNLKTAIVLAITKLKKDTPMVGWVKYENQSQINQSSQDGAIYEQNKLLKSKESDSEKTIRILQEKIEQKISEAGILADEINTAKNSLKETDSKWQARFTSEQTRFKSEMNRRYEQYAILQAVNQDLVQQNDNHKKEIAELEMSIGKLINQILEWAKNHDIETISST